MLQRRQMDPAAAVVDPAARRPHPGPLDGRLRVPAARRQQAADPAGEWLRRTDRQAQGTAAQAVQRVRFRF